MRNLKFSFALLIAIAAVGITLASKASQIGSKLITACFEQVQLQNGAGTLLYSPGINDDCDDVRAAIATNARHFLRTNPATGANIRTGCELDEIVYCCITFDVDPLAPPTVPNTTPGGAPSGKYKVVEVLCEPEL